MKYNTQNDNEWRLDIMTSPPFPNGSPDKTDDLLSEFGCLTTSFANIIQLIKGREYTPRDLNNVLRENKGYFILAMGKDCPINQESYIVDKVIENTFDIEILSKQDATTYRLHHREFYIACWNFAGGDHFSNVIGEVIIKDRPFLKVFNVYNGCLEVIARDKIKSLKKVVV